MGTGLKVLEGHMNLPSPGLEPGHLLHWKLRVSTTGPPGKVPPLTYLFLIHEFLCTRKNVLFNAYYFYPEVFNALFTDI